MAKYARNGKDDVIGMSLGAYTAIHLAAKYPDTIGEYGLFLSGCGHTWPEYGSWSAWVYGMFIFSAQFAPRCNANTSEGLDL